MKTYRSGQRQVAATNQRTLKQRTPPSHLRPPKLRLQAKLTLGPAKDRYEQEADAVADRVLGMPDSESEPDSTFNARKPLAISTLARHPRTQRAADNDLEDDEERESSTPESTVQRALDAEGFDDGEGEEPVQRAMRTTDLDDDLEDEDDPSTNDVAQCALAEEDTEGDTEEELQTKARSRTPKLDDDAIDLIRRARQGGRPLSEAERSYFEPRFGRDLSGVRVHSGAQANSATRRIRARAFTVGNDIVLGNGEYQASTPQGKRLLAHELTHVVQQQSPALLKTNAATPVISNGAPQRVRRAPMPAKRTVRWNDIQQRLEHIDKAILLYSKDMSAADATRVNQLVYRQLGELMRSFQSMVRKRNGIAGLSQDERDWVKKTREELAGSLNQLKKVSSKDVENIRDRRKIVKAQIGLMNNRYAVYFMLRFGQFPNPDIGNLANKNDLSNALVLSRLQGLAFVQAHIRWMLIEKIAEAHKVKALEVSKTLAKGGGAKGKGSGGTGAGSSSGEGLFKGAASRRRAKLKTLHREIQRQLPKGVKGNMDPDDLISLLDQIAAMPKERREKFLQYLQSQPNDEQKSDKSSITMKDFIENFEALEALKKIADDTETPTTEADQQRWLKMLKKLPPEQREAFVKFVGEAAMGHKGKPKDPDEVVEWFKSLSESDKEKLRINKALAEGAKDGEPGKLPKSVLTDIEKRAQDAAKQPAELNTEVDRINASLNTILSELNDPTAQGQAKPLKKGDLRLRPEFIMLQGMMIGAGQKSPKDIQPAAQKLMTQVGVLQGAIMKEIRDISLEMSIHAGLSLIPFAGWAKAVVTSGRVFRMIQRVNKLRKAIVDIQRSITAYQSIQDAIKMARLAFSQDWLGKFERARGNWQRLQKQLSDIDADDITEQRAEAAFAQLQEQMMAHLDYLEPFFDKLYIPQEARNDPDKLLDILFNLPKGIKLFDEMIAFERGNKGRDTDREYLLQLLNKGVLVGVHLYPLVGFLIGVVTDAMETLANSLDKRFTADGFRRKLGKYTGRRRRARRANRGRKKGAKQDERSHAGSLFGKLFRRYTYEPGELQKHFTPAFAELQREVHSDKDWKLGLRILLRLRLRKFVRRWNAKRLTAQGRQKGRKHKSDKPRAVPIPKFKYKLSGIFSRGSNHRVQLKLNPVDGYNVKKFSANIFKTKTVLLSGLDKDEDKALKRWFKDNDYTFKLLPKVGWHIRRKGLPKRRRLPYLKVKDKKQVVWGASGQDQTIVDDFLKADTTIVDDEAVPEGYTVNFSRQRTRAAKLWLKAKRGMAGKLIPLHIGPEGKLVPGVGKGRRGPPITLRKPTGAIKEPNKFDQKRPKGAVGPVAYIVNAKTTSGSISGINLPDKRRGDDNGHIIASRFGGTNDIKNLVPMNRTVNQRGAWYKSETAFATAYKRQIANYALKSRSPVGHIDIDLKYNQTRFERRPEKLRLKWWVELSGKKLEQSRDQTYIDNK